MSTHLSCAFTHPLGCSCFELAEVQALLRDCCYADQVLFDESHWIEDDEVSARGALLRQLSFPEVGLDSGPKCVNLLIRSDWLYLAQSPESFAERLQLCQKVSELFNSDRRMLIFPSSNFFDYAHTLAAVADLDELIAWFRTHHGEPASSMASILTWEGKMCVDSGYLLLSGGCPETGRQPVKMLHGPKAECILVPAQPARLKSWQMGNWQANP